MIPFVLYCKSYRTDLKRLLRLAESVKKFNVEKIPFYVSVPRADFMLFSEELKGYDLQVLADEDILRASPRLDIANIEAMPGNLSQQVVKSEFWRLGISDSYLCLDSDAIFIRPFGINDYIHIPTMTPYTVISEAHDLMEAALANNKSHVFTNFVEESQTVKSLFGRHGKDYSFGPMPMVWNKLVWQDLEKRFLIPRNMNFADAISFAPLESRWYGEALLAFRSIQILPSEAFFKVFHYAWQYEKFSQNRNALNSLTNLYSGIILQSSWDREMDWPSERGSFSSQFFYRIKRHLGRV